jgi:hypothetical protein
MKENQIIRDIQSKVNYYSSWTLGITNNPQRQKKEHNNPQNWSVYQANTYEIAIRVESHFIEKGMKSFGRAGRGEEKPRYVYIFKA